MEDLTNLEGQIGPRGAADITSANRNLVRRWLCARGVDSPTARSMTLGQLQVTYNDATDATLRKLQTDDEKPAPARTAAETPAPKVTPAKLNGADKPQNVEQIANLLAQLLAAQHAQPAPVDESRIIELIQTHAPIRAVEIKRADREPVRLDGHHHKAFPALLKMVSAGVNVWLSGPAGSGKTTLAHQCADALELKFYSTGAVTSDFRLMGFMNAQGELVRTPFRDAYEHGGVFLWDEIDASNPNALTAFNQALANGHFGFPDKMVTRHKDFVAIAAANTYGHGPSAEYVGRTRIDAATLDRFATLYIDYDEELERALAGEHGEWVRTVQAARRAVADNGIKHIVSPRATIEGARLLAAGLDRDNVLSAVVRKRLDDDSWRKVRAAI